MYAFKFIKIKHAYNCCRQTLQPILSVLCISFYYCTTIAKTEWVIATFWVKYSTSIQGEYTISFQHHKNPHLVVESNIVSDACYWQNVSTFSIHKHTHAHSSELMLWCCFVFRTTPADTNVNVQRLITEMKPSEFSTPQNFLLLLIFKCKKLL